MQEDEGWAELERLARATEAADALLANEPPSKECVERWQTLFGYGEQEAIEAIGAQRSDVTRERVSDEHWQLVSAAKEDAGHDRETYEHSLSLKSVFDRQSAAVPLPDGGLVLLFRLGGLLGDAEKVREVAGLEEAPVVQKGWSERGLVSFVVVDESAKKRLDEWLTLQSVGRS
ncbi:hypothetical protein N0V86_000024 [Didymella sp. IMI 355093]|nr:hypothetical protein N0V86_000024 [Didymella sp. IMI 355093]